MEKIDLRIQRSFGRFKLRSIKYLALVNSDISSEDLVHFLIENQRYWGGGYTVIVPLINGEIVKEYQQLAYIQDPDYVLYPKGVNIDLIKIHFNPIEFVETIFGSFHNLKGVDVENLLDIHKGYNGVVIENYLYKEIPTLYNFYKLNFGFFNNPHIELPSGYDKHIAGEADYGKINNFFTFENVCLVSELCRYNVSRLILKPEIAQEPKFELVIGDSANQFNDLLYYWNRVHFFPHGNRLNTIYMSTFELDEFFKTNPSPYFFRCLTRDKIHVRSFSLEKIKLSQIVEKINQWQGIDLVQIAEEISFPFKSEEIDFEYNEEIETSRTFFGINDIIQLPSLTFGKQNVIYGKWIVDYFLQKETVFGAFQPTMLPIKPNLHKLFSSLPGRILRGAACVQVSRTEHEIPLFIPDENMIFQKLLLSNQLTDKPIVKIEASDDGKRLSALLRLFNGNYNLLNSFLRNEFWLNVFRSVSCEPSDNCMKTSKGVYSLTDLEREFKYSCVKNKIRSDEKLMTEMLSELRKQLNILVEISAVFIGYKVKCNHCGSNSWYSLTEVGYKMTCNGCQGGILFQTESTTYYKINDIIVNNLIPSPTNRKKYHGNYTVYLALAAFKENSHHSFIHYPSQNYFNEEKREHVSDIDIICLSDGNLIIGEAKNSIDEFNNKERNNLAYLIDRIQPDKVVLAFNEGRVEKLNEFIKKLTSQITNKLTPIESFKVPAPIFI